MLEVILVDDEPLARQSLRYLIDWEEHGFRIAAEAEDGMRALGLLQQRHFSLVVTDIRMPVLNGLEFVERLREFSDVPAVILSGYDDFEYARQGIKLGVRDYLLKPVDEDDLIALLRRLREEIAEKERQNRKQRVGQSALRDAYLRKAAHGSLVGREFREGAALAGVDWIGKSVCAILVELDSLTDPSAAYSEREAELKRFAVRNILEELTTDRGFVFEDTEERMAVLLVADEPEGLTDETLPENARRYADSIRRYAKESVTIGVGETVLDPFRMNRSFESAERSLDAKFMQGGGKVLTPAGRYADIAAAGTMPPEYWSWETNLIDAIRSLDRDRAERSSAELRVLAEKHAVPGDVFRLNVLGLYVQLYHLVRYSGADPDPLFDRRPGDYEAVMRARTVDDLIVLVQAKCGKVFESLRRANELQPNKVTAAVMAFVSEKYGQNISLRQAAKQVYLNPNYLGKLFKSTTGQSFQDYVLQVRMEKAKELLLHTDLKVYEIAQQVGYGELDWFYKKFKAYANLSASEFRAKREQA